ncbi:hypothetical protein [Intrasporangium sp. DVR]|uniref:hypothetical protein n=1 Tax=Intrasporangium sp. DVR TaxID=3127867 RepID=UPI00313A6AD5
MTTTHDTTTTDGTTTETERPARRGLFRRTRHSGPDQPLTDAEAQALAARVPHDPIPLDPNDLACAECGRVVAGPFDLAAVRYAEPSGVELAGGVLSASTAGLPAEPLTTCPKCAARGGVAADLAGRLLPGGVAIGGLHYTGEHVARLVRSSLVVIDVLGVRPPDPDHLTRDVLGLMVRRLASPGSALAWSHRFAPTRAADAQPGTANPRPWAHVRESARSGLRRAYADLMADRLSLSAPPVALAPPPIAPRDLPPGAQPLTSGCLLCGVATVARPALAVARDGGREAAARRVWTARPPVGPGPLGGRPSAARLVGYTCPTCTEALDHAGAVGPSAMERSLTRSLGVGGKWTEGADALGGLVGFGALAADALRAGTPAPQPNTAPWAHVPNLDAIAHALTGRG